ncbi:MAG: DUF222 domain-containing protein, partial [Gemmatimonadota bacterium]
MIAFPTVPGPQLPAEADPSAEADSSTEPCVAGTTASGPSRDGCARVPAGIGYAPVDPTADSPTAPCTPTTSCTTGTEPAELEELGDEIARLSAHLHAATYRLLVLIRAFDERGGWGGGFRSCGHWLSWRTGIAPGAAREKVRVARALGSLPRISEGMARGELSYSKVRALTRVATPENEGELVETARHTTAAQMERLVRGWRRVDRQEELEAEGERHGRRYLHLYPDEDGSYLVRGRLDPEVGALLRQALAWAGEALYRGETTEMRAGAEAGPEGEGSPPGHGEADSPEPAATAAQRRADALGLVVERAMAVVDAGKEEAEEGEEVEPGGTPRLGSADRFQVVVHVDAEALEEGSEEGEAVLADSGVGVSAETSRRVACDSAVVEMRHDGEGGVLDVGRKRRTVPPALRRALEHRDGRSCRFPGCGCRYTDAHHIRHWADGGETRLDNLVLLCRRHHRAVHEEGFRVELVEGARGGNRAGSRLGGGRRVGVRFHRPDGRLLPEVPELP